MREPAPGQAEVVTGESLDRLAGELAALGAESETERAVKRLAPWVVSAAVHAGMVALGFLVTWTVVRLDEDQPPTLIIADFNDPAYEPVAWVDLETDEPPTDWQAQRPVHDRRAQPRRPPR